MMPPCPRCGPYTTQRYPPHTPLLCPALLRMGDLHKEVATFMVQGAESDAADDALIKGIFQRTNKCTELVKTLAAADPTLSPATMEAQKVPASTQRFLYNLALAEGIITR